MGTTLVPTNYARVGLKGLDWVTHYLIVLLLWLPPATLFLLATMGRSPRKPGVWHIAIACLVLGALALWQQRRVLRYRAVQTTCPAEANYESVLALAARQG